MGRDPQQLRNPFRSEADAFRLLVLIGAGVAAIVLAFELAGPWVGTPVSIVLAAVAAWATYRWVKLSLAAREGSGPGLAPLHADNDGSAGDDAHRDVDAGENRRQGEPL